MKLSEFANKYNLNFNAKKALVLLLSENPVSTNDVSKAARNIEIPFEFKEGSILEKMVICNKMVKSGSCPNNVRNNFYHKKKHFFKCIYERFPKMLEITDQGEYYSFKINGFEFHQLKSCWPELKGDYPKKEYSKSLESMEYDNNAFIDFCLSYFTINDFKRAIRIKF